MDQLGQGGGRDCLGQKENICPWPEVGRMQCVEEIGRRPVSGKTDEQRE